MFEPNEKQKTLIDSDLAWFLDSTRSRGEGRSELAAFMAVQLCIQIGEIYLYDPSLLLTDGTHFSVHRNFKMDVLRMCDSSFRDYIFEYHANYNTLVCKGKRKV